MFSLATATVRPAIRWCTPHGHAQLGKPSRQTGIDRIRHSRCWNDQAFEESALRFPALLAELPDMVDLEAEPEPPAVDDSWQDSPWSNACCLLVLQLRSSGSQGSRATSPCPHPLRAMPRAGLRESKAHRPGYRPRPTHGRDRLLSFGTPRRLRAQGMGTLTFVGTVVSSHDMGTGTGQGAIQAPVVSRLFGMRLTNRCMQCGTSTEPRWGAAVLRLCWTHSFELRSRGQHIYARQICHAR